MINNNKWTLTQIINKEYVENKLKGFNILQYMYEDATYECKCIQCFVSKEEMYNLIEQNNILPINFEINGSILNVIKFPDSMELIKRVAETVRKYMEVKYGQGTDLCGYCIEASEHIVSILINNGINSVKSVEGWCLWDDDTYGSDAPYDAHTWVEIATLGLYIDVTADQFNPGMYKAFPPVVINKGLPSNMKYDRPVENVDY